MGFFSGLDVEAYDRQYSDRQLLSRMGSYFRPYALPMVGIGLLSLFNAMAGAAVPLLLARALDLAGPAITAFQILIVTLVVLASGVLVWAANWWRRRLTARVIGDVVMDIRVDGFRAATEHDLSFYDENPAAKVISRITSDTREFGDMIVLVTDLISAFGQAILLSIVLIFIQGWLSLILFAQLPIFYLAAAGFRAAARRTTQRGMRAMGNVNAAIKETVSGIAVAKNFRQEEMIFNEFNEANQGSYRVNIRRGLVLSSVFPTLNALAAFGNAILLYIGGNSVAEGVITAGAWYLFMQSLGRFIDPVLQLASFWTQVQSGLSAAERSFALIDAEPKVLQVANDDIPGLRGEIEFQHFSFRYTERQAVLRDFNLHIAPGENVALVGHTGAGKSSIAKLVARFYEFQEGRLLIDGKDIRTFNLAQYRRQ